MKSKIGSSDDKNTSYSIYLKSIIATLTSVLIEEGYKYRKEQMRNKLKHYDILYLALVILNWLVLLKLQCIRR